MKLVVILLVCFLSYLGSFAQRTGISNRDFAPQQESYRIKVSGVVIDAATNKPIKGAKVYFNKIKGKVPEDNTGEYKFSSNTTLYTNEKGAVITKKLYNGNYQVKVKKSGYLTKSEIYFWQGDQEDFKFKIVLTKKQGVNLVPVEGSKND